MSQYQSFGLPLRLDERMAGFGITPIQAQ